MIARSPFPSSPARRALLLPIGSSGDVNPFVWMGRHLQERGYSVSVVANPYFARHVTTAGLDFIPLGTEEEYHALTNEAVIWHPRKGTPRVLGFAGEHTRRHFDLIASVAKDERPLLLAPSTAFGARLAREKLGLTLLTVNLQPSIYRSIHETPDFGRGLGFLQRIPRVFRKAFFALVDARMNQVVAPGVLRACRDAGVPAPRNVFRDWWQSPDGALCLFPDWYAPPQPDWPANARCLGFPLEDLASQHTFEPALEAFLAEGEPPVLFTAGTAMTLGHEFFASALRACQDSKRRALFLTRYPAQLPANLPPEVRHFHYLPFSDVLPRCSAIVHHGGIGTTSQGLAAGIPQLIMPLAHDQPDNADRIRKLGVGARLWPHEFQPANIVRELDALLTSQDVAARCLDVAGRIRSDDPASHLLTAIAPHLSHD